MTWIDAGRFRYVRLVATRGRQLVAVFAILGLVTASVAVLGIVSPPMETVDETTSATVVSTEGTTAATVTGESELYERGTVLRDSPVYLTPIAPELTITVETTVSDGRSADVTQQLALVYRAEQDGETFWRDSTVLARENGSVSGGPVTASATVNVDDVRQRLRTITRETGPRTKVHAVVTHRAEYRTGEHEDELTGTAPLSVSEQTYSLRGNLDASRTHLEQEDVTRPIPERTHSLLGGDLTVAKWSIWAGVLALAFWIVAVHAAVVARRSHDLAALERRFERQRFAEWISRGEVPSEVGDRQIAIDSLTDLVDVAIDADRRVIYDPDRGLYVVVDDGVAYTYVPDSEFAVVDLFQDKT